MKSISVMTLLSLSLLGSTVTARDAVVTTIDPWERPDLEAVQPVYPPFNALPGDTVNFIYGVEGTNQDVYIHDSTTCEMGPTRTRVKGNIGPGTYTFTDDDAGPFGKFVHFACDVGFSCERGQYLRVTVFTDVAALDKAEGRDPADSSIGGGTGGSGVRMDGTEDDNGDDAASGLGVSAVLLAGAAFVVVGLL